MRTSGRGCGVLVFVLLAIGGVVWMVFTFQGMELATESKTWPSVAGEIEKTWIEEDRREDAEGDLESYYEPFVRYSYQVGGSSYASERLNFGFKSTYGSRSRAIKFLDDYPVGMQVEVFYAPENPSEAVLTREMTGATGSIIGSGALILISIVGAIGLVIRGIRTTRKVLNP